MPNTEQSDLEFVQLSEKQYVSVRQLCDSLQAVLQCRILPNQTVVLGVELD
jgi:hypothetical protein